MFRHSNLCVLQVFVFYVWDLRIHILPAFEINGQSIKYSNSKFSLVEQNQNQKQTPNGQHVD